MPQQDAVHDVVKNAMEKDGWSITAKPHTITYFRSQMYADLRAEKTSEDGKKTVIVVEVKSFRGKSAIHEFHAALGQYISHRDLLQEIGVNYPVYLGMTQSACEAVFNLDAVRVIAAREWLALLIVDEAREEISQWIH